jgi:beta-galactosidase
MAFALLSLRGLPAQADTGEHGPYEISGTQAREGDDPYLTELYWSLNDSPMQQRLRRIRPLPVGVVYYQQRDEGYAEAKEEFETIRDLGFTALKQVLLWDPDNPEGYDERVFRAAIDAGISPWYYGKGGWADITPELVGELGIELDPIPENMPAIQSDPRIIEYQRHVWHERVSRMDEKPPKPKGMGEPGRNSPWMPERLIGPFADWLEEQYGSIGALEEAWNCGFIGSCDYADFTTAARELLGSDFDEYGNGTGKKVKDFRRYRDAMKFQSELIVENYQRTMDLYYDWDPDEPERTGGHQLFENQAMNTWDLEGQAKTAAIGGSFYSSIHLTHHLFLADNEIMRPVYWQARTIADMFKGGWAAVWESTGGPSAFSGYQQNTVDGGTMAQLFTAYLAAGLKGIGVWMWNSRGEGWEVGEYALTDVQGDPAERAIVAGRFAERMQENRFELWEALDEPTVGILYSWENDATLGRMSLGQYELNTPVYATDHDAQYRQYHSQGRLGVSRALMNHHVPFEYLTERDLSAGLAGRYPVIYLPYMVTLSAEHREILKQYVADGGRLVADFPVFMLDTYGRLNKQREGSGFPELFGFQVGDYQHTFNRPLELLGEELYTLYGDLKLKGAEVIETFAGGVPAVVRHAYGEGEVLLFNFEAGRQTFRPGNDAMEAFLTYHTLGDHRPPYAVSGASSSTVTRRSAPEADHYFILNDGAAETITVTSDVIDYGEAVNVYSEEVLPPTPGGFSVEVPERTGVWVRVEK